jgi:hypothetical protein
MICIGLPLFSGDLQDDYLAFEERFLAWMRFHSPAHGFSELNRTGQLVLSCPSVRAHAGQKDLLQLAMVPNSAAHAFYAALEGGFGDRLAALHQHFGSDTRVKSKQLSALNKLALREREWKLQVMLIRLFPYSQAPSEMEDPTRAKWSTRY